VGRLAGKVCVVTGSSGMAADAARVFAQQGAGVVVIGVDEAQCAALGQPYELADLRDEGQAEAAFARIRDRHPRVDAVYCVAGGSGRRLGDGPVHEMGLAAWEATLALNLTPAFLAAREAVRIMLAQPRSHNGARGSIVLMSSVLAFAPAPTLFGTHAYAAAKAAEIGLVRAMAGSYAGQGIRINALAPALVNTPMAARAAADPATVAFAEAKQGLVAGFLEPSAVTAAALFLCTDDSTGVTGQVLTVDGGWTVLGDTSAIAASDHPPPAGGSRRPEPTDRAQRKEAL
jgi:NAD(P)-dependent dehydrogenase (short-subunit alcohol dehydrogenase family)